MLFSQRKFEINCSVKNLDPWLEKRERAASNITFSTRSGFKGHK
jgi:hypothetical protein